MELLGKLPAYKGRRDLVKRSQDTGDIIEELVAAHQKYATHYDQIAQQFLRSTARQTLKRLYSYLKINIRYDIEPDAAQTVKSPAAIVAQGYGDCKHYASFICGVMDALIRAGKIKGCEMFFRFASYDYSRKEPQHVFAVALVNGREIWIDPVPEAGGFDNREKEPVYYQDKKTMALYSVSGIDDGMAGIGRKRFRIKIRAPRFLLKVAAAPSRNAFLLILKVNLFGLAYKIKQQILQGKEQKWKDFWQKAGGNYKVFRRNVDIGSRKKERKVNVTRDASGAKVITGIAGLYSEPTPAIGVLPAVAAAVAAATPLVVMVVKMLRGDGVNVDDAGAAVSDAAGSVSGIGPEYDEQKIMGICGIAGRQARKAARKAKRAAKKTARKAKRTQRKAARQAKRAARKASKGGGGDDGGGVSNTAQTVADAAGLVQTVATGVSTATNSAGMETVSMSSGGGGGYAGGGYGDSATDTGGAMPLDDEGGSSAGKGFAIDSKTLLLGGAAVVAAIMISKKK